MNINWDTENEAQNVKQSRVKKRKQTLKQRDKLFGTWLLISRYKNVRHSLNPVSKRARTCVCASVCVNWFLLCTNLPCLNELFNRNISPRKRLISKQTVAYPCYWSQTYTFLKNAISIQLKILLRIESTVISSIAITTRKTTKRLCCLFRHH